MTDPDINRLSSLIRQLQGMLGGKTVRVGVGNLTWPGAVSLSNQLTVPHGLGHVPIAVFVTVKTSGQGEVVAAHANADATNMFIQAQWVAGFAPGAGGTLPVSWMVVG